MLRMGSFNAFACGLLICASILCIGFISVGSAKVLLTHVQRMWVDLGFSVSKFGLHYFMFLWTFLS